MSHLFDRGRVFAWNLFPNVALIPYAFEIIIGPFVWLCSLLLKMLVFFWETAAADWISVPAVVESTWIWASVAWNCTLSPQVPESEQLLCTNKLGNGTCVKAKVALVIAWLSILSPIFMKVQRTLLSEYIR